jgi:hypothetical protein
MHTQIYIIFKAKAFLYFVNLTSIKPDAIQCKDERGKWLDATIAIQVLCTENGNHSPIMW